MCVWGGVDSLWDLSLSEFESRCRLEIFVFYCGEGVGASSMVGGSF